MEVEGVTPDRYETLLVGADGETTVFAKHLPNHLCLQRPE
jgi:hypothetical protein